MTYAQYAQALFIIRWQLTVGAAENSLTGLIPAGSTTNQQESVL